MPAGSTQPPVTPVIQPPGEPSRVPSKQPPTPAPTKDVDLAKLAELQKEYETLKKSVEADSKVGKDIGEAKARKGDLTREIDAIKRKHDLP